MIPIEVRQQLAIAPGHCLEVSIEDGRIVLTPQINRLRQTQALLAELAADDSRWLDELIAERSAEAKRD